MQLYMSAFNVISALSIAFSSGPDPGAKSANPKAPALPSHIYNFQIPTVHVIITRSGNAFASAKDTVFMKLSVAVNNKVVSSTNWDGKCTGVDCHGDGREFSGSEHAQKTYHMAGGTFNVDTGPVTASDRVAVSFDVVNAGDKGASERFSQAGDSASKAYCTEKDSNKTACTFQPAVKWLISMGFPGCDGPLASDTLSYTGAQLETITAHASIAHPYPLLPGTIYTQTPNPGDHCGRSGEYKLYLDAFRKS